MANAPAPATPATAPVPHDPAKKSGGGIVAFLVFAVLCIAVFAGAAAATTQTLLPLIIPRELSPKGPQATAEETAKIVAYTNQFRFDEAWRTTLLVGAILGFGLPLASAAVNKGAGATVGGMILGGLLGAGAGAAVGVGTHQMQLEFFKMDDFYRMMMVHGALWAGLLSAAVIGVLVSTGRWRKTIGYLFTMLVAAGVSAAVWPLVQATLAPTAPTDAVYAEELPLRIQWAAFTGLIVAVTFGRTLATGHSAHKLPPIPPAAPAAPPAA